MTFSSYQNIIIQSICAAVPKNKIENKNLRIKNINKIIKQTGIKKRRILKKNNTVNDLFKKCSQILYKDIKNINNLEWLICVSQTADYKQPSNSYLIHSYLKLPHTVACLDLNVACSGFAYGLNVLYSLLSNKKDKYGIILFGDSASKYIDKNNSETMPLFGDAAGGVLVKKTKTNFLSSFNNMSDGSRFKSLIIKGGGYKYPFSKKKSLNMNGIEVFKFSIFDVFSNIYELIKKFNIKVKDIDFLILHQSNKQIMSHISTKLKLENKMLLSLSDFGNTGSASIPLTIVFNKKKFRKKICKLLISGYGAGLSWSSGHLQLNKNIKIHNLLEL